MFKKFRREKRNNKKKSTEDQKPEMDGKQAEQFFAMCFTLNTLLRSKFMGYRYVCFLAKVVLHECKQKWIDSRKKMKQNSKEFDECIYLTKFIKVKESRAKVRMNSFMQFHNRESSLSKGSRLIMGNSHVPTSKINGGSKGPSLIKGSSIASIEMTPALKHIAKRMISSKSVRSNNGSRLKHRSQRSQSKATGFTYDQSKPTSGRGNYIQRSNTLDTGSGTLSFRNALSKHSSNFKESNLNVPNHVKQEQPTIHHSGKHLKRSETSFQFHSTQNIPVRKITQSKELQKKFEKFKNGSFLELSTITSKSNQGYDTSSGTGTKKDSVQNPEENMEKKKQLIKSGSYLESKQSLENRLNTGRISMKDSHSGSQPRAQFTSFKGSGYGLSMKNINKPIEDDVDVMRKSLKNKAKNPRVIIPKFISPPSPSPALFQNSQYLEIPNDNVENDISATENTLTQMSQDKDLHPELNSTNSRKIYRPSEALTLSMPPEVLKNFEDGRSNLDSPNNESFKTHSNILSEFNNSRSSFQHRNSNSLSHKSDFLDEGKRPKFNSVLSEVIDEPALEQETKDLDTELNVEPSDLRFESSTKLKKSSPQDGVLNSESKESESDTSSIARKRIAKEKQSYDTFKQIWKQKSSNTVGSEAGFSMKSKVLNDENDSSNSTSPVPKEKKDQQVKFNGKYSDKMFKTQDSVNTVTSLQFNLQESGNNQEGKTSIASPVNKEKTLGIIESEGHIDSMVIEEGSIHDNNDENVLQNGFKPNFYPKPEIVVSKNLFTDNFGSESTFTESLTSENVSPDNPRFKRNYYLHTHSLPKQGQKNQFFSNPEYQNEQEPVVIRLKSTQTGKLKESNIGNDSPHLMTNIMNIMEATEFEEEEDPMSPETPKFDRKRLNQKQKAGHSRFKSDYPHTSSHLSDPRKLRSQISMNLDVPEDRKRLYKSSNSNSKSNSRSRDKSTGLKKSNFGLQNRLRRQGTAHTLDQSGRPSQFQSSMVSNGIQGGSGTRGTNNIDICAPSVAGMYDPEDPLNQNPSYIESEPDFQGQKMNIHEFIVHLNLHLSQNLDHVFSSGLDSILRFFKDVEKFIETVFGGQELEIKIDLMKILLRMSNASSFVEKIFMIKEMKMDFLANWQTFELFIQVLMVELKWNKMRASKRSDN